MAITARAKKTLQDEIGRLRKERDQIDKDIKALTQSLSALGGSAAGATRRTATRARRAVKPKVTRKRAPKKDWKPTGRAAQALKAIKASPGITGAEIAKKLKMKNATGIYPAINKLKKEGLIKKKGKGFVAS